MTKGTLYFFCFAFLARVDSWLSTRVPSEAMGALCNNGWRLMRVPPFFFFFFVVFRGYRVCYHGIGVLSGACRSDLAVHHRSSLSQCTHTKKPNIHDQKPNTHRGSRLRQGRLEAPNPNPNQGKRKRHGTARHGTARHDFGRVELARPRMKPS